MNKLKTENFAARLNQADLVNKTGFDNDFFLGRIYFTSNDRSQNIFFYQRTLELNLNFFLELKKDKGTDYVLSWELKGVCNSKFICYTKIEY